MKRLCLVLALLAGVTHAGQKVYVPEAGVYVDMDTGQAYPRVAPHVALDPNSGRAFVPGMEQRPQVQQQSPANADCAIIKNPATDKYVMRCRQ